MKKILLSGGLITFIAAIVITSTGAFFSDSETSTGNTFTAGSIDLSLGATSTSLFNGSGFVDLDPDNSNRALFGFTDLKPRDMGSVGYLLRVTSNEAYVCASSSLQSSPENTLLEPETEAGDLGAPDGELHKYLKFATFADFDNDGEYDAGIEPVNVNQYFGGDSKGFTFAQIASVGWVPVADPTSPSTWLTLPYINPDTTYSAGMLYCFGDFTTIGSGSGTEVTGCTTTGPNYNDAQSDSVSGMIEFMAIQTRNNDDFTCASLNP